MGRVNKWFFIIGGILLAVLIGASFFGGGYYGWGGAGCWGFNRPGMWGGYGGFGTGWFMPIVWVIIFGLIVMAAFALLRGFSGNGRIQPVSGGPNAALDILNRRYASGELSKEEFEEKKKDLL